MINLEVACPFARWLHFPQGTFLGHCPRGWIGPCPFPLVSMSCFALCHLLRHVHCLMHLLVPLFLILVDLDRMLPCLSGFALVQLVSCLSLLVHSCFTLFVACLWWHFPLLLLFLFAGIGSFALAFASFACLVPLDSTSSKPQ